ncbi:unnamed protein product, partial [Pylaiella littoralis]
MRLPRDLPCLFSSCTAVWSCGFVFCGRLCLHTPSCVSKKNTFESWGKNKKKSCGAYIQTSANRGWEKWFVSCLSFTPINVSSGRTCAIIPYVHARHFLLLSVMQSHPARRHKTQQPVFERSGRRINRPPWNRRTLCSNHTGGVLTGRGGRYG